jgi:hypothetical protein
VEAKYFNWHATLLVTPLGAVSHRVSEGGLKKKIKTKLVRMREKPWKLNNTIELKIIVLCQESCQILHRFTVFKLGDL